MAVAAVLPVVQSIDGVTVDLRDPDPLTLIAPFSVPVAGIVAAWHTPRVLGGRDPTIPALWIAGQAVLLGVVLIALVLVAAYPTGDANPVAAVVFTVFLGLLLYGGPVFLIAWIVTLVWAHLLRRIIARLPGAR